MIEKETKNAIEWIKEQVEKAGAKGVVVGNSGGKDSATVIAMATKALGKERVLAIYMPCYSNPNDFEDAKLVAQTFGVKMLEINLSNTFEELKNQIEKVVIHREEEARINTKPRLRMTTLYYIAREMNYLVIGTGNKSEAVVGYTTKWGDNASDFNPIGEFTAEEVCKIGSYLGVPEKIIKKDPSDGLDGLTDEQKLGVTYKQISEYIKAGKTDEDAMKIIKEKEEASKHKRNPIPTYEKFVKFT